MTEEEGNIGNINIHNEENYEKYIKRVSEHSLAINFIKKNIRRLHFIYPSIMIEFIMKNQLPYYAQLSDHPVTFIKLNGKWFDKDGKMKPDMFISLKKKFEEEILPGLKVQKNIQEVPISAEEDKDELEKIDDDTFMVDKFTTYQSIMKAVGDGDKNTMFKYDFKNPDMPIRYISDAEELQRCKIMIPGNKINFDYIYKNRYCCPKCGKTFIEPEYKYRSVHNNLCCNGDIVKTDPNTGNETVKRCNTVLNPDEDNSMCRNMFYYTISYDTQKLFIGDLRTAVAISFKELDPGFYDAVLYRISSKTRMPTYFIVDVYDFEDNVFLPPTKNMEENYVLTFVNALDDFVERKAGVLIRGLVSPKIGLLFQTIANYIGMDLFFNVQLCGEKSTGKSMLLEHWGFLLNGGKHLSTNGLSISIPALRGTRRNIIVFGKEHKAFAMGLLAAKTSIHIDEAMSNPQMVEELKMFLFNREISYDKSETEGTVYKRTAHVNLSENLNQGHLMNYIDSVKREYKDTVVIEEGRNLDVWDDSWDLYMPLEEYGFNPYLKAAIQTVRKDMEKKQKFWIDGHDLSLHDRFPFYYYLVTKKDYPELMDAVMKNIARVNIMESLELIRAFKSSSLVNFFNSLEQYKNNIDGTEWIKKVEEVLRDEHVVFDARLLRLYSDIVKLSRIVNQRNMYLEEDYDILRYIIRTTNRKIDIKDLDSYALEKKESGVSESTGGDF